MVPLLAFGILFTIDESRESLSIYLFKRALHRISEVPTVDNRFYILGRLVMELLPQIIFVVLVVFISQLRKKKTQISAQIRESLFFITVGLSASVPLMLTMVQKGFYFVPALPFFAIGLSMLIAPVVAEITGRIEVNSVKYKVILIAGLFLFIGALSYTFMQKGEVRRDKEMLHDVYVIGDVVPARSIVTLAGRMSNEWELQCYLIRYFNISLDTEPQKYCIRKGTNLTDSISGYKKVNISTIQYDLYQQQ
jgi:hypothetical protein